MDQILSRIITKVREQYASDAFIPLHEPRFQGNERKYVLDCIDTTFVSSVGKYVDRFEEIFAEYTGAKYAIATVNGTAALHMALKISGVEHGDEVITQPLTFVATCNAIAHCGASPVFVDVERCSMGMCPSSLKDFLSTQTQKTSKGLINVATQKRISAVVPMHTFGHPCKIDQIAEICQEYGLALVEDAAESLGSYWNGKHTGRFGTFGVFSFNGNKVVTTGGGGMIITDDESLAKKAKHLTTTAKIPHPYEFVHDDVGYNYRLPNINAALGCAQMEMLPQILQSKRQIAMSYAKFFSEINEMEFVLEPKGASSNYWLNAIVLDNPSHRDLLLTTLNKAGVMSRPIWRLMNELDMYKASPHLSLANAKWLEERVINIPSSAILA